MKYLKILPAAAGVIALTATVAFARDSREAEENYSTRIKVAASEVHGTEEAAANIPHETSGNNAKHIYLVEVARDNTRNILSIDANTGHILENRKVTV